MDRLVYIDGNLLVSDGILYGLRFCAYADEKYKTIANKIISCNEKGYYESYENTKNRAWLQLPGACR